MRRFRAELRMREIAEHAEPIVDRHDDDAARRELRAVVERLLARAAPSARRRGSRRTPARLLRIRRRPDVQRQAILADRRDVRA